MSSLGKARKAEGVGTGAEIFSVQQIRSAVSELLGGMEFEDWRKEVTPESLYHDMHAALLASRM